MYPQLMTLQKSCRKRGIKKKLDHSLTPSSSRKDNPMGSGASQGGTDCALPPQNIEPLFDPNAWGDDLEPESTPDAQSDVVQPSVAPPQESVNLPRFRELPVVATAREAVWSPQPCGPNPFRGVGTSQRSLHSGERSVTFQDVVEGADPSPSRSSSRIADPSTQSHKHSKALRVAKPSAPAANDSPQPEPEPDDDADPDPHDRTK